MNAAGLIGCLWPASLAVLALLLVQSPRQLSAVREPLTMGLEEPLEITIDRPVELPGTWRDFNLIGEVELSGECELDIVFRRVEPQVDGPRFHGRFTVLRLSALEEGPAYRTREQALFGDDPGGVRLGPGIPASIRLEARGTHIEGNVAGRRLPPVETVDDHGTLLLAVRGGKALLRKLETHPVTLGVSLLWLVAPILGFLAGAIMLRSRAMTRFALTSTLVPLGALLSSRIVIAQLYPMTRPDGWTELLLAMWCLPLGMAIAARPLRLRYLLAATLAGLLALEVGSRREVSQLLPFEDPRLSLYFGPRSGAAPIDAVVRRVRAATSTDFMKPAERRIFYMGGKLAYEPLLRERLLSPDLDPSEALAIFTNGQLVESLGADVVGTVIPTLEPNALQQLLLLRAFYLGFAPRVLVFKVTSAELVPVEGGNVRRQLEVVDSVSPGAGLVLASLLGSERAPAATPGDLEQTLDELVALCRGQEIALVLMMESDLEPELRDVVRRTATARDVPLCVLDPRAGGEARARSLHDVLLPLLR